MVCVSGDIQYNEENSIYVFHCSVMALVLVLAAFRQKALDLAIRVDTVAN